MDLAGQVGVVAVVHSYVQVDVNVTELHIAENKGPNV